MNIYHLWRLRQQENQFSGTKYNNSEYVVVDVDKSDWFVSILSIHSIKVGVMRYAEAWFNVNKDIRWMENEYERFYCNNLNCTRAHVPKMTIWQNSKFFPSVERWLNCFFYRVVNEEGNAESILCPFQIVLLFLALALPRNEIDYIHISLSITSLSCFIQLDKIHGTYIALLSHFRVHINIPTCASTYTFDIVSYTETP